MHAYFWNNVFYFLTGISVSISTFSLVAIAIERYSAICNPLKSRVWQTRSHAYRVIAATWVLAFLIMIPYPIISHLDSFQRPDNTTAHQCRHKWPLATAEQTWWVYRFEMGSPLSNSNCETECREWKKSVKVCIVVCSLLTHQSTLQHLSRSQTHFLDWWQRLSKVLGLRISHKRLFNMLTAGVKPPFLW